jgi:hypothetical protein
MIYLKRITKLKNNITKNNDYKCSAMRANNKNSFKTKLKYFFKKLFIINYELNKRFLLSLLIFNCVVLIYLLLLNLYISYELMIKIEEYIKEYIYLYNLALRGKNKK